jgi:hypothetical protein
MMIIIITIYTPGCTLLCPFWTVILPTGADGAGLDGPKFRWKIYECKPSDVYTVPDPEGSTVYEISRFFSGTT